MSFSNVKSQIIHFSRDGNQFEIWVLILIFCLSRLVFYYVGLRFDSSDMEWTWLDITLLKKSLLESCFYLHSQPPGFNFLLGLILKVAPNHLGQVFHGIFLLCSLIIYICLFRIMRLRGFGFPASLLLSTIFIISPEALLYENWLHYTWIVATLLVLAAFCLQKYQQYYGSKYLLLFFVMIASVCTIRATYNLVYFISCGVLLLLFENKDRKMLISCVLIGGIILSGFYLKNFVIFGVYGPSSWLGMNLWRVVRPSITMQEFDQLANQHNFPPLTQYDEFLPIWEYPPEYRIIPSSYDGIQVLCSETKNGVHPNRNHIGYVLISKEFLKASIKIVKTYPIPYMKRVLKGLYIYVKPSYEYCMVESNSIRISKYINFFKLVTPNIYITPTPTTARFGVHDERILPILPLFVFLLVVSLFIRAVIFGQIYKHVKGYQSIDLVSVFGVVTILYSVIISNLFEIGENNRFRVEIDPLMYLTLLMMLSSFFPSKGGSQRQD